MKTKILTFILIALSTSLSGENYQELLQSEVNSLYISAESGLKLRETPDLDAKTITLIPFNEKVKFIDQIGDKFSVGNVDGKWTKISYKNYTGYAFSGYLYPYDRFYHHKNLSKLPGPNISKGDILTLFNDYEGCPNGEDERSRITFEFIDSNTLIKKWDNDNFTTGRKFRQHCSANYAVSENKLLITNTMCFQIENYRGLISTVSKIEKHPDATYYYSRTYGGYIDGVDETTLIRQWSQNPYNKNLCSFIGKGECSGKVTYYSLLCKKL